MKPIPTPLVFPRDAVVQRDQLAAAFRVSAAKIDQMDLPCVWVGRTALFVYGQVLDTLMHKARGENARGEIVTPIGRHRRHA